MAEEAAEAEIARLIREAKEEEERLERERLAREKQEQEEHEKAERERRQREELEDVKEEVVTRSSRRSSEFPPPSRFFCKRIFNTSRLCLLKEKIISTPKVRVSPGMRSESP